MAVTVVVTNMVTVTNPGWKAVLMRTTVVTDIGTCNGPVVGWPVGGEVPVRGLAVVYPQVCRLV